MAENRTVGLPIRKIDKTLLTVLTEKGYIPVRCRLGKVKYSLRRFVSLERGIGLNYGNVRHTALLSGRAGTFGIARRRLAEKP